METRTCKVCGETKPFARGSWRWTAKRGAFGTKCLNCFAKQSAATKVQRRKTDKEFLDRERAFRRTNDATRRANDAHYAEYRKAGNLAWAKRNKPMLAELSARRRRKEKLVTPRWLSPQDINCMRSKYAMARWLSEVVGAPYHVDHIIPLQGVLVSGLHVPDNLCILKASENISKNNKWQI